MRVCATALHAIRGAFRVMVFAGVATSMIGLPLESRLLSPADRTRLAYDWRMFHDEGQGLCIVRYTLADAAGARPLDRYRALGYHDADAAPAWLRRIYLTRSRQTPRDLRDVTLALCARLGRDAPSLRLHAVCGDPDGWVPVFAGRQPVCEYYAARPPRGRR
jgi:hypothetical protein